MPNSETKVLDEDGAILLTSNIKTLADATYPANAAIASPYNSSISYIVGSYCLHNGLLYKCNTDIPVGGEVWTAAHWTQVNLGNELALDRKMQFTNVFVDKTLFIYDTTYENFPYRAAVPLTGVKVSMYPEVVLNVADSMSGIYAPVVQSYNGGIYLYANIQPTNDLVISSVICWIRGINLDSSGSLNIADEIQTLEDNIEDIEDNINNIEDDITIIQNTTLKMELLWTNASPNSSFAAQTVTINLSNYDAVLIHFRSFTYGDNTQYECNQIVLNGTTGGLFASGVTTSNNGTRRVTVSNSGLDFLGGYWNGNTGNDYEVPLHIYGIKGVITI